MGIAVAGATYSVNIELNTGDLKAQLGVLDGMVSGLGKKKAAVSKEETKTQTKLNNLLNSNAVQYGRSLRLNKKDVDITQEKLNYSLAVSKAMKGDFKAARELISYNRLSNTEKKNDLIINEKKAESIDALYRAQHKNFNLRTRIEELDRKGVNVYKIRQKYGELNSAQSARQFDAFKNISRELDLQIKKEERKWRWMNKQNKELERRRKYSVRMGGAKSPLRGDPLLDVGSPAYNDRLAREGGPRSRLNYRGGRLLPGPAGTGGRGGSNVWQSAAISGAFPLLFGQGPVTAAAGAIGGGLGAKFGGQMGGFAGGLATTTAVQAISGAVAGVRDLGQAMGPFVEDTSALMRATGQTNTFREKELKLIEKVRGKQAAFNAAMKDMAKVVGQKGVEALKTFGEDTKRLSDDWARFMTQMGAGMARLINWSGLLKESGKAAVKRARREEYSGDETLQGLLGERDALGRRRSMGKGANAAAILEIQKKIKERLNYLDKEGLTLQDEKLKKLQREETQVKNIASLYKDIGDSVKDGLVDAIDAAIAGTKSLGEVAGSVLRDIGRTILQYGINSFLVSLFPNSKTWGKIFGRASGGPVKGGDPYVVGEKGPELFVPNSSGNIVPNHAMGGSNMVVNVDASGTSVEGDDDRSRQLGELIGAAVQAEIVRQQRPGGTLY